MENYSNNNIEKCVQPTDKFSELPLHPIVLKLPETTLADGEDSDNSGNEVLQDVARQHELVIPDASTINIENSSDVVIGPLTQFHAPVTIYQTVSSDSGASCEKISEDTDGLKNAAKPSETSEKHNLTTVDSSKSYYKRLILYISIAFVMLVSILITVAVTLNVTSDHEISDTEDGGVIDRNETNKTLGKHHVFTRNEWRGRKSLNFTRPLHHPTEYVLISHTAGSFCENLLECSAIMRQIQSDHVSTLKSPDIGYNFLIGGDGNIYVGRGWDIVNFHRDNNVGISFIGNYVYDELTPRMISALKELLKQGVDMKKLKPDFKLVCHNQTYATLSPGNNVYEVVSKLPNFYPGFVIIE